MKVQFAKLVNESRKLIKKINPSVIDNYLQGMNRRYGEYGEVKCLSIEAEIPHNVIYVCGYYFPVVKRKTATTTCYLKCGYIEINEKKEFFWWADTIGANVGEMHLE